MEPMIRSHTTEQFEHRRQEIIDAFGGDEDKIRERAANYQLTVEEDARIDELKTIDFLLGR